MNIAKNLFAALTPTRSSCFTTRNCRRPYGNYRKSPLGLPVLLINWKSSVPIPAMAKDHSSEYIAETFSQLDSLAMVATHTAMGDCAPLTPADMRPLHPTSIATKQVTTTPPSPN